MIYFTMECVGDIYGLYLRKQYILDIAYEKYNTEELRHAFLQRSPNIYLVPFSNGNFKKRNACLPSKTVNASVLFCFLWRIKVMKTGAAFLYRRYGANHEKP